MKTKMQMWVWSSAVLAGALAILAGCQSMSPSTEQRVELSGSNEVPPVTTAAKGIAVITITADRSVRAEVTVSGMTPTASHIHEGAAGANGPVIVPFTKSDTDTNVFVASPGAKLTEAQYASYKAGNLYVNVHSAKNPGGELRGQLKGN
jgi:hypothetical protein